MKCYWLSGCGDSQRNQTLWRKVIRSKYGLQDNGWNENPPLRGSSRSPWKDISCGLQSFLQCCKFEVGNGERVRFWQDGWVEGGPLKEQYVAVRGFVKRACKYIVNIRNPLLGRICESFIVTL